MNCIAVHPNLRKLVFSLIISIASIGLSFGQNPVADENQLTGTPQTAWDAHDNAPIEGFPEEFSVNKGETVHFKIDVESLSPVPYTVKIYRLGWYNGDGARYITDIGNSLTGSLQPPFNVDPVTGKVDCNNWTRSTEWAVPSTAVSGVYIARLDCPSLNAKSIVLFVVRNDDASSDLLFKTSDATWQAYNNFGGNTFYGAATPVPGFDHATKVSYQRPLRLRTDKTNFFNSEYPMLRWLEKNGYDVSYATDMDMARDASVITPAKRKTILSVGHDEYYSLEQRTKFENARAAGVHFAFFSGNEMYWKTRWEDNYQTLVCYKEGTVGENLCGFKCDPLPNVWTGLWRDGCAPTYAANDGCNPEGSFTGQMSWTQSTGSIKVPDTYKNLRFWKNTSIASLGSGQTAVLPYGTLGNEWDPEQYTQTYPDHRVILSNTVQAGFIHKMALYKHSSGALVFSSGTMQWPWGLDDKHDLNTATPPVQPVSTDMKQATVNLLHDMGATATTLESGLVAPTILPDALAPTSTIVTPVHNTTVAGPTIIISGTSVDNGSGAIGGVEVSTDNGVTWANATGLENWTYSFSPTGYGTVTIKVRAWDDLGNVEIPGAPGTSNCITISLSGPFNHSVFLPTYPTNPPPSFTGNPVELGMKFQSLVPGVVTGFRYYKGAAVTGTHIGHLWTSTGTLLASATFTNETASGWQSVMLSTPVAIDANTTYIVSYFTSSGDFNKVDPFFTTAVVNGFLRGLADNEDGGNGVYAYDAAPIFPDNNFGSSNYFADVLFESSDATAPTVVSVTPADNTTGVVLNIHPTATFDEGLDASSVNTSTVVLTDPGNNVVPGTVTLTGGNVITFIPNADLAIGTTYTMTLKGGITEPLIKDISGNAIAGTYSWSFTTGGLTTPTVTTQPVSQSTCSNSSISMVSAASGIPTPTVQWQVSTDNGGTWTNIPGAISATYTFTALSSDNNNQYHAVWTNSQGSDISNAATLSVAATITGSIAAVNTNICPGAPLLLQLTSATGPAPYSLQINAGTYSGITVGTPFTAVGANETIWLPATVPAQFTQPDNNSVELGVKFKTNKDGIIKGIRFFKGSVANGGTHVGSLWSQSGTLLGSATFTNETASGWQEVSFATPIAVTANTTYVASYFAPQGNYSRNGSYFVTDVSNGNSLTALQNTVSEPNGVYLYTAGPAFPVDNAGDPNYWVDVVFAPYITTTTTFNFTNITAANGCSLTGNPINSATITVSATTNAGTVSGSSPLCIGATTTYSTNGHAGGSWSSTNPSVATVNPATGVVSAIGAGQTDITYTVTGCSGTVSSFQTLTVNPNANAGSVTGTSPVCVGATTNYSTDGDAGGTWTSANPAIATVNALSGVVTGVAAGSTTITYTVGCNAVASAGVTVSANANPGTVSGTSPLCIGATATYTSNGDAGGTWSSSNTAVATVNPITGLVTAQGAGSANIIYTVAGCNGIASAAVTVSPNPDPGTVSGTSPLCIGASATYSSNGAGGGSWSTSNGLVATVNPATGLVTATGTGTVNIIYTLNSGCNTPLSSLTSLTVSPNANAGTVSGTSPICIGATTTYTSNGDAGGTWSTGNPAIATVNALTGDVTGVAAGSTTIIYTVGCNAVASANITISVNANAGTVTGATGICIGATTTYSNNGADAGGTWTSSNTSVATINPSTGFVTAVSAGTSTITYTVNSGCNNPVFTSALLTVADQVTGSIAAVNANICPGAPMQLQLTSATGPAPYTLQINSNTYTGITVGTPFLTVGTSETIWTPATTPSLLLQPDNNAVELGVKFKTNKNGVIKGIRFYKGGAANGGTHIGSLWSQSGTLLASATFTNETTSGWQEVLFSAPVDVTANTTYVASYFAPLGNYSKNGSYFVADFSNGNSLTALQNTVSEPNGVYVYTGGSPAFPVDNAGDPNYWVDVVFAPYTTTTTTFNLTNITAANGCTLSGSPINSATITVSATTNAGTVSGLSPLCIGATATYSTNGNAGGTWSSSNTLAATVNPTTGVVTAVGAGSANITYTVTGCSGTVSNFQPITITPNANPGTVSGTSPLCIGATATYTSNGQPGGTWSSSNTSVATVSAGGLVTAIAAGTADIRYTVNVGCNSPITAFQTVTVSPDANAGTITGPASLCTLSSVTFTSNGDAGGVWGSSNPLIATVDANTGQVSTLLPGNTTISYTIITGCNIPAPATQLLTVSLAPNAGTVSGTSPLCIGATDTYTSDGVGGGTWSSSNPAVASVNATTGLVTALSAGTTDITYTLSGCLLPVSASKTLTVNSCANTVNLKLFIKGYYMGGGLMQPVMLNQGVGVSATDVDNITVELHNTTAPYAIVATATGMLKTNGVCSVSFPSSFNGSYYIAIKHRNSIQTWSATPMAMTSIVNYDFTTAANKAYGDNMADLGDGSWAFFTGDINQDENIDLLDYPDLDFDINNFSSGFYSTDLNGDGNVDLIDYPIWDANNANFISSAHP